MDIWELAPSLLLDCNLFECNFFVFKKINPSYLVQLLNAEFVLTNSQIGLGEEKGSYILDACEEGLPGPARPFRLVGPGSGGQEDMCGEQWPCNHKAWTHLLYLLAL